MNLCWRQSVRLSDVLKQSLAAQVHKELKNLGLIQAEVFPGSWGEWTTETLEQESWGSARAWVKGQAMESQLDGKWGEGGGRFLLWLSRWLCYFESKATYLWASVFSHLKERVLAHSVNIPSSSKILWFNFAKMQVLFDHEWETLPTASNHWGQTTFSVPEKQIPSMFPDHWCNSFIFSWKYEKRPGPFP